MCLPILLLGLACSVRAPLVLPAARAQENSKPVAERRLHAALPLRNLSADAAGAQELERLLRERWSERGVSFVPEEALERVLRERRVRYTDSLALDDARAVRDATGASFALTGTVFDFQRGAQPRVALCVRVIDLENGSRARSALVSLRGEDFRGLLGLGAIEDVDELVERALSQVFEELDAQTAARVSAAPERVAVLPFVNRSGRTEAGSTFAEILAHEWFVTAGVQVLEASELRSALVRARIRTLQEMDAQTLASIGALLGVRRFALGSVERFGDEVLVRDQRYPEVEITLRIVDALTGLVVESRNLRLRGDDGETLLRLGIERDPLALARDAARQLVTALKGGL